MKNESKRTVEDCLSIDSRTMAKSNSFMDGISGTWVWERDNEISSSMGYEYRHGALILSFIQNGANHAFAYWRNYQAMQLRQSPVLVYMS